MKYINQKNYPHWLYTTRQELEGEAKEKGKTTTISSSGCGICSAIMVAHRLIPNCEFDLTDAINIAYETNANAKIGTDYQRFAPVFAEKLGLDFEKTNDPQRLRYCLRTGGAAVLHVKGDREGHIGVFSTGGHYIAAISASATMGGPTSFWSRSPSWRRRPCWRRPTAAPPTMRGTASSVPSASVWREKTTYQGYQKHTASAEGRFHGL